MSDDSQVVESSAQNGFIVCAVSSQVGSVVGIPDSCALSDALREVPEILAFDNNIEAIRLIFKDIVASPVSILTAPKLLPEPLTRICRGLESRDIELLSCVPPSLRHEISEALSNNQLLVAAFDGQLPVAFAYSAFETESLWDVSIDTIPSHRRRGFARAAVVELMRVMEERGKSAVWAAREDNPASINLALRLGFEIADRIWVLSCQSSTSSTSSARDRDNFR